MEEKTVLINGLKVNFKVAGLGPAILILHGWGGSSDSWIEVQQIISEKGYKVYCPDFPGFGKSIAQKKAWSLKDYVNWLNLFTESQALDNFILIGHSFGGRVALRFAAEFSERVKKLVLCDSAGIKRGPDFKTKIIFFISRIGNIIFSPKIMVRFKDRVRNIFYLFLRHKDYVKAKGVMRETIRNIFEEDSLPFLQEIKAMTLIVWGQKDKMVPLKDAYLLNEKIEGSKLKILPDVGHSPNLDVPENLADIILDFLINNQS